MQNQKKATHLLILLNIIIPLFAGAVFYYYTSPNVFFVKYLNSFFGLKKRPLISLRQSAILKFVRNYGLDYLWAYALTGSIFFILETNVSSLIVCFVISIILGTILELSQLVFSFLGTFDYWDILAESIGSLSSTLIIKKAMEVHNEKNSKNR